MATQSADPLNPAEDKPQTPEAVPSAENHHDAKAPTSVFVNSEPMREDQVQNAVKFLSHPKVRGSPVMYRRSFLERKGLSKEEIDEAFRRVPDPPPSASNNAQPSATVQATDVQPQVQTSAATPTAGIITKTGTLQSRFHWTHALLAIGVLALSGAGTAVVFKKAVVPRLKSWIRKVVSEGDESSKKPDSTPSLEQEAAAAAKAAAAAAADVARASQEMLLSKTEEKKCFEELINLIGVQVQEMKSMSSAIQKLEGQANALGKTSVIEQGYQVSSTGSKQPYTNGNVNFDQYSARSLSQPATVEPPAAPHPKSYMEIMAMVQRGEKPSNIRDINDLPPNPNQPLPNAMIAPRAKPWEVAQNQNSLSQVLESQKSGGDSFNLNSLDNGLANQSNGDSEIPWWQKKNNRITEIENGDELRSATTSLTNEQRPVQRSWVPPQPPPVAIPEAAAAIRQPKKPFSQKQAAADDNPSDANDDELQRITKISEMGGVDEVTKDGRLPEADGIEVVNGRNSGVNISEIEEESY